MYFQYGDKEIEYLRSKDKKLAEVIDKVVTLTEPLIRTCFRLWCITS